MQVSTNPTSLNSKGAIVMSQLEKVLYTAKTHTTGEVAINLV